MRNYFIKPLLVPIILLGFQPFVLGASHKYLEKTYQDVWCKNQGGKQEVILYDKARVDCVTTTHAIEFDFAKKWGESIGQALYYASITGKKPGIVLILEDPSGDKKYLNRVNTVAKNHGITVWTMTPADVKAGGYFAKGE